jgi:hypothetical protein
MNPAEMKSDLPAVSRPSDTPKQNPIPFKKEGRPAHSITTLSMERVGVAALSIVYSEWRPIKHEISCRELDHAESI